MKKKLLLFIFLAVLINICWKFSRASIYYYKIPYANKMLTIYIPALSDTAYAYIGTHKMEARIDSFDLKIFRNGKRIRDQYEPIIEVRGIDYGYPEHYTVNNRSEYFTY